jgi:hypothetical protein
MDDGARLISCAAMAHGDVIEKPLAPGTKAESVRSPPQLQGDIS